jgi:hypothetical protein
VIDYGKLPTIDQGYYTDFKRESWLLGHYGFNYAPEVTPFFAKLKQQYNIGIAVETGTYLGGTTVVLSFLFDAVHTIENCDSFFNDAKVALAQFPNVHCHFGSSELVLHDLLPSLKEKRVLFYLDTHWQANWPLLNELEEISKTHRDNCIIVIDDFKVPRRWDIPYDAYDSQECSYEYVKEQLSKVFTAYTIHYVIPKSVFSRAKFVAIPTAWQE